VLVFAQIGVAIVALLPAVPDRAAQLCGGDGRVQLDSLTELIL
jgi:hypothetical protein